MKNAVREKLLSGQKAVGTFFELGSSSVAECLGLAGLDYIVIDNEHGPFNPQTTLEYVRAAGLYHTTPFARVEEISRPAILKLLDAGVMGLIIPCVKTVEEVQKIVEYGKYGPVGHRGVACAAGTGFWYEDYAQHGLDRYFEVCNRETMLIPQCETLECLRNLEQIVRIEGVDGIFVGPYDLSTAMGKPGAVTDPEVTEAVDYVQRVCKEAGKFSFIYSGTEELARLNLKKGFDSVTLSQDASMITDAYKRALQAVLQP